MQAPASRAMSVRLTNKLILAGWCDTILRQVLREEDSSVADYWLLQVLYLDRFPSSEQ
jgi:hypothetical protein